MRLDQRFRAHRFHTIRPDPRFDRPNRNLIVTGIPRSGTSLLSSLISTSPNMYCVNEVFYGIDRLPANLCRTRQCLVEGRPVPNKYSSRGTLSTNTVRDWARVEYRRVKRPFDEAAVVASNVNIPYLNEIERIREFGYAIVAVVRDPLFTLASWNSQPARSNPEFRVTDEDRHPRWSHLFFPDDDRINRQAVVWRHYANLVAELGRAKELSVISYERIMMGGTLLKTALPGSAILAPQQPGMNTPDRYPDAPLDEIRSAVERYGLGEVHKTLTGMQESE